MRALVTGCCGFIGSNLYNTLLCDDRFTEIIGVDDLSNGNVEFLNVNKNREKKKTKLIINDFASSSVLDVILDGKIDVVFHLAANPRVEYSVQNPVETTEQNVMKTVALISECIKPTSSVKRFIFSSSCAVYGDQTFSTDESCTRQPNSPYGLQKAVIEDYLTLYDKLYGLKSMCLRYFNVYGPNQFGGSPYSTAVCAWCNKIKNGEPLRSDGDGTQSRDMVHVQDVVQANILMATIPNPPAGMQCFNVGTGQSHTNNEILDFFKSRYPGVEVTNAPWRPGDVMHTKANISKIKAWGYVPKYDLLSGLEDTIKWWEI